MKLYDHALSDWTSTSGILVRVMICHFSSLMIKSVRIKHTLIDLLSKSRYTQSLTRVNHAQIGNTCGNAEYWTKHNIVRKCKMYFDKLQRYRLLGVGWHCSMYTHVHVVCVYILVTCKLCSLVSTLVMCICSRNKCYCCYFTQQNMSIRTDIKVVTC